MKRRDLTGLKIQRVALCASQAQDGAEIVIAKRKPVVVAKLKPNADEDEKTFVARFVADAAMRGEYPEDSQRAAVAHSMYREHHVGKSQESGGHEMTPEQEKALQEKVAKAEADRDAAVKKAERAERVATLTDAEKDVFKTLSGKAADDFLVCSGYERAEIVKKADAANEVVYKAADGRVFRKSHDPMLVAEAKRGDQLALELAKSTAAREEEVLKSRARTEVGHLPGDEVAKVALLRAVDAVPTADGLREKVVTTLKAADAAFARLAESRGTRSGGGPAAGSAEAKLQELAKARHATTVAKGESLQRAYAEVLKTPEGRELYARMRQEEPAASAA